jgi:hypothetical protein
MKTTTGLKFIRPAIASIVVAVATFLASGITQLHAVPSAAQHEMSGTVQQIDHATITIVPAGEAKPEIFAWNKDTKFVRNGAFTSIGALHSGDHVVIRCSHPIFGSKPLLYHVAWHASSTKKGK